MIEGIVNTLNLTLETTGRIDKRYCLTELRTSTGDNATTVPYAFEGNGQLKAIDYGKPSLSWWRMTSPFSVEEVTATSAVNKKQGNYSLRLVVMYRRKESTADDGFTPAWLAEDLASVLTQSNGDLKTVLKAADVRVNVTSTDIDTTRVWNEEFADLEFKDPKYTTCLIAFELSVVVIARSDCWETECDYDTDILHTFNFCNQSKVDRLTPEQEACLITALCGTCDDATVNINDNLWTTVASGETLSGQIHDTAGNDVGTIIDATEIEIADNTINFNGSDVDSVKAQETYTFTVELDSVQAGTYDAGTNKVSVTSVPVPKVDVTLSDTTPNFGDTITITATPSGGLTPDEYKYLMFDGTDATLLACQAGNTYDYLVNSLIADIEIYAVGVEDGVDIVGGGEFATVQNIPSITDSVHFSGTNNYATVAADSIFDFGTGEVTQGMWIKTDTVSGNDGIFETSYGTNGIMIRRVGENLQLYLNGGAVTVNNVGYFTGEAGNWVCMIWTRTAAGAVTVYKNGTSFASGTETASLTDSQSLKWGKWGTEYFEGNLLTPFFVDRLLTGAEITEASATPAVDPNGFTFYADIIEYWNFGTGDTIPTLIGGKEGKNATTTNMTAGNIEADVP